MSPTLIALALLALSAAGYRIGRRRALGLSRRPRDLPSLPGHYGSYVALWALLPAAALQALLLLVGPWLADAWVAAGLPERLEGVPAAELERLLADAKNLAFVEAAGGAPTGDTRLLAERFAAAERGLERARTIAVLLVAAAGLAWGWSRVSLRLPAMARVERTTKALLACSSTIAILTTIGIVLSLLFEAVRFFRLVPVTDFLFGLEWSPQTALRADQVGSSGAFGAVPLFAGTLLVSAIAMAIAVPLGLLSAIFLSEYAKPGLRTLAKPLLEVLAGIPTVVYGFFAALTVAPLLRGAGESLGLEVASESALAAGGVMGVMIIPIVSSLSDDVIRAVPQALREASYGLGATRAETIRRVVFPAALPGIVGGILLAVSRAIGETMIVVMAAGLAANLTANPLAAVTTVTVQIVTLLVGDQEFDSAKTLSAFALGLVLFVVTLGLNVIALQVVRRYREQYE